MIHRMEDKNQGASKKKIQVRKPRSSSDTSVANLNYEEDYYIPIASNDSQWNGIKFTVPRDENIEHTQCTTDIENEVKVIELENVESPPLLLLFPELKSEEINFQNLLKREVSTTDVTKMLVGKKPNLALLKPCKKINSKRWRLTPVEELSESDDYDEYLSLPLPLPSPSPVKSLEEYTNKSSDTDVSNNEKENST